MFFVVSYKGVSSSIKNDHKETAPKNRIKVCELKINNFFIR